MRKSFIVVACVSLLLSGCGTFAGTGAMSGASLGSILGSAVGGLGGGYRGSNVGTVVGMAAGAAIGGAIGAAADQKVEQQQVEEQGRHKRMNPEERQAVIDHYHRMQRERDGQRDYNADDEQGYASQGYGDGQDGSGYDPDNAGDDRLYDFNDGDENGNYGVVRPTEVMPNGYNVGTLANEYSSDMEITNVRFVDANHDGMIGQCEVCEVTFEVMNRSGNTVYNVLPFVIDATRNKHITITPSVNVEQIAAGEGVLYTAIVQADSGLGNGSVKICLSAASTSAQGNRSISKVSEFNINTQK